jgi:hypothetical protein
LFPLICLLPCDSPISSSLSSKSFLFGSDRNAKCLVLCLVFIYVMTGTTAGRGILAKVAMCVLDLLRADVLVSLQPNKVILSLCSSDFFLCSLSMCAAFAYTLDQFL